MAKPNLYGLDPLIGIRNPDELPMLVKRGIANVMCRDMGFGDELAQLEERVKVRPIIDKKRKRKKKPPSRKNTGRRDLYEVYARAFNIITVGLTKSGRLRPRTLKLTGFGMRREAQVKSIRDAATNFKIKKLTAWLDQLQNDLDEGRIG